MHHKSKIADSSVIKHLMPYGLPLSLHCKYKQLFSEVVGRL